MKFKIYSRLCNVFEECNIMSKRVVYQWIEEFKVGRSKAKDEPHSGQPSDELNEDNIPCVCNLLQKDH